MKPITIRKPRKFNPQKNSNLIPHEFIRRMKEALMGGDRKMQLWWLEVKKLQVIGEREREVKK